MTPLLPVRRLRADPDRPLDAGSWPATVPAVRQLLADGLDLGPVTVLTGENGVGKSTLAEALAVVHGLNPQGGSVSALHRTRATESVLGEHLQRVRDGGAPRGGFFLRAETMHSLFSYQEEIGVGAALHELSHGESFLEAVAERWRVQGLWVLDEPESALSLTGSLALLGLLREQVAAGSQVVLSTHSPVLAAFPGARLLELGEWGMRESADDDLELVRSWRAFLEDPRRVLRHLP